MIQYPEPFLQDMQELLGEEYPSYQSVLQDHPFRAVRVNTLKCSVDSFLEKHLFDLKPTPFCKESFYVPYDTPQLGRHPYHHAGAFYLQEPSASSVAEILDVKPGDRVLDLCAAPGGKSTQIAAKLMGEGLLWSNEYVMSRAKILLSNIERMGIRNAVVSSMHPEPLCERLSGYFDKVLVDAPCSGEGMFRKEKEAIENWSKENVKACAVRQLKILENAANTLKQGGILVYSTCTFSLEENEQVIDAFLQSHPEFSLERIDVPFGRPSTVHISSENDFTKVRRIFPMDGGEGHFIAKMVRTEGEINQSEYPIPKLKEKELVKSFLKETFPQMNTERLININTQVYSLPDELPLLDGMNILRAGVLCGQIKPKRFEPHHHLYTSSKKEDTNQSIDLSLDDPQLISYLKGQAIPVSLQKGYTMVCVNGISLGFGKVSDGMLKNHYPKGLRLL